MNDLQKQLWDVIRDTNRKKEEIVWFTAPKRQDGEPIPEWVQYVGSTGPEPK